MLPKKQRLTTKEFKEVFEKGVRYNTPSLLCIYLKNQDRGAISCAVAKKQYPNAVDRNRARRIIYGCINELPSNVHVVLLLKKPIDNNVDNTICAEIGSFLATI